MISAAFVVLGGLASAAIGAEGDVLFQEKFDGPLQSGWQWIRGDESEWRVRDGGLHVRSQPGRIWGGNDAKNLLLVRPPRRASLAASVSVVHRPKEKYEQAGLLWYVDDDNFVKLISEQIDGKMYVVLAREQNGRGQVFAKIETPSPDFQLRLAIQSNRVVGQWRLKDADSWSDAGACGFDAKGDPRFGLFTQNGPKDQVRWVWFDDFVIAPWKDGS